MMRSLLRKLSSGRLDSGKKALTADTVIIIGDSDMPIGAILWSGWLEERRAASLPQSSPPMQFRRRRKVYAVLHMPGGSTVFSLYTDMSMATVAGVVVVRESVCVGHDREYLSVDERRFKAATESQATELASLLAKAAEDASAANSSDHLPDISSPPGAPGSAWLGATRCNANDAVAREYSTAMPRPAPALSELEEAEAAAAAARTQAFGWLGVRLARCNVTGEALHLGRTRYRIDAEDYDLCADEWSKLSTDEQRRYTKIEPLDTATIMARAAAAAAAARASDRTASSRVGAFICDVSGAEITGNRYHMYDLVNRSQTTSYDLCETEFAKLSPGEQAQYERIAPCVDDTEHAWSVCAGAELETWLKLEPELGDSPIRLVDARFLVSLARQGGQLCRRQELPDDAFVDLSWLRRMPEGTLGTLRVLCVSHPWLQPDDPDPRGDNLRLLASLLRAYVEDWRGGTYAVLLDFASIVQRGPCGERTPCEERLLSAALSGLSAFYAHPHTTTLKITQLPVGYPRGFTFPEGAAPNVADYNGRGWCTFESAVSGLVKGSGKVLDLAHFTGMRKDLHDVIRECTAGRSPPLVPVAFRALLATKSFTSKNADLAVVGRLYEQAYRERMATATELLYGGLGWGDADVAEVCLVLESGVLAALEELGLFNNAISDTGIARLAKCLREYAGALPALRRIYIGGNLKVGAKAKRMLKAAAGRVEIV